MAITRTQIARQLYRIGGVGGRAEEGPVERGGGGDKGGSDFGQFARRQQQNKALEGKGFLGKDLGMNIGEQDRLAKFGDLVKGGGITGMILSSLAGAFPSSGTTKPVSPFTRDDNKQMDSSIPLWAQLGFNNEEDYLASLQAQETMDQEPEVEVEEPFEVSRRFRAEGGIMNNNVVGGEMDFESARQMYGLGKLVKKVTRSVKKIAKSPIGKAALLYAGGAGLGALGTGTGFAGFKANLMSPTTLFGSLKNTFFGLPGGNPLVPDTKGLFGKGGEFALGKGKLGIGSLIGATSLLPLLGLGTGEESEEEAQAILDNSGIDIEALRANPQLARRFRAEGGSMNEPVAKKTMPLLDMDGKEMDLRAEGGFVPIGRMEKADDVPARLSKNEFVFTADAVRNAGDGDVDKGAEVMYNMMKNLESGGDVSEESQGLEGARKMFQTSQRLEEVL